VASFGVADVQLTGGAFDLGQAELDSITLPSITPDTAGLVGQGVGFLSSRRSLLQVSACEGPFFMI